MSGLIIGIIIGATFAEFWRYLYRVTRKKIVAWMANHQTSENNNK